jgi:murein DD-endopeptidase MepM/ murein hydrolase activator NlpD
VSRRSSRGLCTALVCYRASSLRVAFAIAAVGISSGPVLAITRQPSNRVSLPAATAPQPGSLIIDERPSELLEPLAAKLQLDAEREAEEARLARAAAPREAVPVTLGSPVSMATIPTKSVAWLAKRQTLTKGSVTSGFGLRRHPISGNVRQHHGVDFAAPSGSPIIASADGKVGTAGWQGGYGLLVALDHKGGVQTRYAHLSAVTVTPGQRIRKGDVIGYVGSTGRSTGPHLHYEVRIDGRAVDPLPP